MKRLLLTLSAAILAICSANAGTVTRKFGDLKNFSGIQICNAFEATLMQGDDYSADVTIDTDLEEYLDVSVVGQMLYVRLKDAPLKIKKLDRKSMKVTITVPSLSQISLTGASKLTSDDIWTSPMGKFTLEMSGASKAENLKIEGSELDANISGASSGTVTGDFSEIDAEISGASALFLIGSYDTVEAECSGASKISFIGSADSIHSECSGTSLLDAIQLKVKRAEIECSGASKATIDVQKRLEVELTGASNCQYRSENESLTVVPDISRASSLKKVN